MDAAARALELVMHSDHAGRIAAYLLDGRRVAVYTGDHATGLTVLEVVLGHVDGLPGTRVMRGTRQRRITTVHGTARFWAAPDMHRPRRPFTPDTVYVDSVDTPEARTFVYGMALVVRGRDRVIGPPWVCGILSM
jgi:hypothetical protein